MGRLGDAAKQFSNGSMFIKFTSGTEITLRLLGDPWIRTTRYEDKKKLDANGQPTVTVKTSFMWPVYDYAEGTVRLLDQGPGIANSIDAIDDKWHNNGAVPPSYDLTISATGEGMQRRYTVVPTPHQGTMPPLAMLELPDMAKMAGDGAVSLKAFLAGEQPQEQVRGESTEPKKPTYEDMQNLPAEDSRAPSGTDTLPVDAEGNLLRFDENGIPF